MNFSSTFKGRGNAAFLCQQLLGGISIQLIQEKVEGKGGEKKKRGGGGGRGGNPGVDLQNEGIWNGFRADWTGGGEGNPAWI